MLLQEIQLSLCLSSRAQTRRFDSKVLGQMPFDLQSLGLISRWKFRTVHGGLKFPLRLTPAARRSRRNTEVTEEDIICFQCLGYKPQVIPGAVIPPRGQPGEQARQ